MVNSPLATVTEGHQRNVLKIPSRRSSEPVSLTTTSGRHLLLTVRPGAAPSTRLSPPLRTPAELTSGRNATRGKFREPQQPYQTRLLTAVDAAGLACPTSTGSRRGQPPLEIFVRKALPGEREDIYVYMYVCVCVCGWAAVLRLSIFD